MGGTPSQKTKQSSETILPQNQQMNIDLLMSGARDLYQSGGPQYFQGNTYAGPTANELFGREAALNYATGPGQAYANQLREQDQFWLDRNNIFQPQNIPGFRESQDYITGQVTNNLRRNILPGIASTNVSGGTLGGSRQGISEGLAIGETNQHLGGVLSNMEMGAYGQGLNMYNQAAARAPMVWDLGARAGQVQQGIGGLERMDQQGQIDADMARWNFEQMLPYLNLQALQGFTGTAGQYGGTTNSEGRQGQSDGGAGAMQFAGTALMAAAMFFSNSMLKENIVPAGGFLEGLKKLGMYRWQYKGDATPHVGPMAEEFYRIFGVGDGITLHIADVLGVILGSIKELALAQEARA